MTPDIEAVARALCSRTELNPDARVYHGAPMTCGLRTILLGFGELVPAWTLFADDAEAAIKCVIGRGYKAPPVPSAPVMRPSDLSEPQMGELTFGPSPCA